MKILWITWKDRKHPQAGGAELVNEELAKRLVRDGHEVVFLVGGYDGCQTEETIEGYKVRRFIKRTSVVWWPLRCWQIFRYYRQHLGEWPDLVIEEINTMPFFSKFYVKQPNFLIIYMLCRKIWFYQFPFPLSLVGYLVEPLYLRSLNSQPVITISDSTVKDLQRHGFDQKRMSIISMASELEPLAKLPKNLKFRQPTLLSLGSIRPMKRTADQIKAFELAKRLLPDLQLKIAGDATGSYGQKVLRMIKQSPYRNDIEFLGKVSHEKKLELMRKSHAILVTSVKEGWGLIVTEAASQGTPAVVYDVDGLRDSVKDGITGLVAEPTPENLAVKIQELFKEEHNYIKIKDTAWSQNKNIGFDQSYSSFKDSVSQWHSKIISP